MRFKAVSMAAPVAFVAALGLAHAQDASMQGQDMESMSSMEMPEACRMEEALGASDMADMMPDMEGMGEHQRAFMDAMMSTHQPMMEGVMAQEPDVAFACGMIPHHQAAINMAEVELQHGESQEMRDLAQSIIDAQKEEIEQLTSWLEEQAE